MKFFFVIACFFASLQASAQDLEFSRTGYKGKQESYRGIKIQIIFRSESTGEQRNTVVDFTKKKIDNLCDINKEAPKRVICDNVNKGLAESAIKTFAKSLNKNVDLLHYLNIRIPVMPKV